ncbi:MAG: redoxin domain-containing protein [Alphaproteobacteria bacterium]
MKRRSFFTLAIAGAAMLLAQPGTASATPDVAKPAPAFTGTDSSGKTVSLADLRGKTVVLEWTNHDCPYVRKHYTSGNMQTLQRDAAKDGIVWLQVISSAPGLEGHVSGPEAEKLNAARKASPTGTLLDPAGTIGRQYAARHTPTMAVIDAKGTLAYYGAIDSNSNWHPDSIEGARNHVRAALADLKAGRAVEIAKTRAYGCSVKYGS